VVIRRTNIINEDQQAGLNTAAVNLLKDACATALWSNRRVASIGRFIKLRPSMPINYLMFPTSKLISYRQKMWT